MNHEDAAFAILSQAPEVWAEKDWPGDKSMLGLALDINTAAVHATLALVEQQGRTADALERIADRLEGEPVNDSTFHIPYVRESRQRTLDPAQVRVESFSPAREVPPHPAGGGTTTPSACCDTGCTQPPC